MNLSRFDLTGKVAVVTGGCSGLGAGFADALSEAGANIVLADVMTDTPASKEIQDKIVRNGAKVRVVKCDVTSPQSVDDMVATTVKEFGKLDILVNSAGLFGANVKVTDMPVENWDKVLAVDLKGTFLCCRAAAREMMKQKWGKIINIASASSFKALPGMAAYATAKSGILMLTKTLALELVRYNIQVNTLSPGYFVTPLNKDFFETEGGKKMVSIWPPRRPGNIEELKGIIIYLSAPASSFITGQEIVVDGGQWL